MSKLVCIILVIVMLTSVFRRSAQISFAFKSRVLSAGYIYFMADSNRDSYLTLEEATNYVNRYGFNFTTLELKWLDTDHDDMLTINEITPNITDENVLVADINKDEKVTPREAAKFLNRYNIPVKRNYMVAFDIDRKGYIDRDDVMKAPETLFYREMNEDVDDAVDDLIFNSAASDAVALADLDKNNETTISEFATLVGMMNYMDILAFDVLRVDSNSDALITADELEEAKGYFDKYLG